MQGPTNACFQSQDARLDLGRLVCLLLSRLDLVSCRQPNHSLEAEKQKVASMSYDEEMQYWAKVVEAHQHQ